MGDWSDDEIRAFERRTASLLRAGMSEAQAEQLAQQMLYRDRPGSGDDRRICPECKSFTVRRCSRGVVAPWWMLQRCDAFALRGVA
jgi:hypothetical protein